MKLYTKRGDDGTTDLFGGTRVSKDNLRVTAYGDVDETNAALGMAATCCDSQTLETLRAVQSDLFAIGAALASPAEHSPVGIDGARIEWLELAIDAADEEVPPLRNFVIPGGDPAAAMLHLARAVCRRSERTVVALARTHPVHSKVRVYLNRLSDLLFALARRANHRTGTKEIPWIPGSC